MLYLTVDKTAGITGTFSNIPKSETLLLVYDQSFWTDILHNAHTNSNSDWEFSHP